MNKSLIIAAFPQAAMKMIVVEGDIESIQDSVVPLAESMFWAADFESKIDIIFNEFPDINSIGILGPAQYTQKFLTDLQLKFKDKDIDINVMGV